MDLAIPWIGKKQKPIQAVRHQILPAKLKKIITLIPETLAKQGTKRKNNVQLDAEANQSTSVKKAKVNKDTPRSTPAISSHQNPAAPRQQPAPAATSSKSKSSKKRPNPTDDEGPSAAPGEPKKKPRGDIAFKSQPFRRTGIAL